MTDEQRKLTPTERLHDIALAAITRAPQEKNESVKLKQAQVGDLKGRWVCDELTVVRHPDEDLDSFNARWRQQLEAVDEALMYRNGDELRDKIAASVAQLRPKGGKAS